MKILVISFTLSIRPDVSNPNYALGVLRDLNNIFAALIVEHFDLPPTRSKSECPKPAFPVRKEHDRFRSGFANSMALPLTRVIGSPSAFKRRPSAVTL
jgi:hypothetical protein